MWEKFDCCHYSTGSSFSNANRIASVMFQSWSNVLAILSMCRPSSSSSWCFMSNNTCPRGAKGALLKSYCPKIHVAAESFGLILEVLNMSSVITAWGRILSHKCMGKDFSVEHDPAI
jgi:hypothetical protein